MNNVNTDPMAAATRVFRKAGGTLRTGAALAHGIHPRTLYVMRDAGVIERLDRGLYRLSEMPALAEPDLVTVAHKAPQGVICLITALNFYGITTQISHAVDVALKRGAEPPRLEFPPIRVYWFSGEAFTSGIECHTIDGANIRIYSVEKTLADCFKYRNKIGMDTVLEALQLYRERKKLRLRELIKFAKICRVEKVIRPYLEVGG
ncbi:MAG: putative transcriptional regulator of viral defense system [Gammaproteobacteria bacterium]|jgi:predicted transcriptional regulator of viral defense system